jgi:hypothetical protein
MTAKSETIKKAHTHYSFGDLIYSKLRSLNRRTIPQQVTKLYINRLPMDISFVMASRSMKKAGIATITKTIQEPFTGMRVSGSTSPKILGTSPS